MCLQAIKKQESKLSALTAGSTFFRFLQLFFKMQIVNIAAILAPLESLLSEEY